MRRRDAEAAWLALPTWEGTHWALRRGGTEWEWVIIARADGRLLATITGPRIVPLDHPREVQVVGGPLYWYPKRGVIVPRERHYLDAFSGQLVATVKGRHFAGGASGSVELPGVESPAGSGDLVFRFPMHATNRRNAVMTAVDNAGSPVFSARRVSTRGSFGGDAGYDVVVRPGLVPSPVLVLVVAVTVRWLVSYFEQPRSF